MSERPVIPLPIRAVRRGRADALKNAANLAYEVCHNMVAQHGYAWPQELAERVELTLAQ
ncbi:hypothetical protein [Ktedonobacter robiniae]|uniref:hypothetical protein n=1 Tax=Ktedonobacter robiniae TaxID=2778365 RepID=UPI0019150A0A|nr:hypothetical protein [Ktedonobacter robiniae]